MMAAIDRRSHNGGRDHALLLFLYNTGARVSEALAVRACDLRLEKATAQCGLLGKGQKERICPLWSETASALSAHACTEAGGSPLQRPPVGHR